MSIARQLLREFRPLFRMLDEPFGHTPTFYPPAAIRRRDDDDFLVDPFPGLGILGRPAVDVTEKGDKYIVDADLPGVSKENLQVRVGDSNQSITIEGKVAETMTSEEPDSATGVKADTKADARGAATSAEYTDASKSTSATKREDAPINIFAERPIARNYSFTRTVWLPRPVDPNNVTAKLQNGILSIILNKAADNSSKVITVEDA